MRATLLVSRRISVADYLLELNLGEALVFLFAFEFVQDSLVDSLIIKQFDLLSIFVIRFRMVGRNFL